MTCRKALILFTVVAAIACWAACGGRGGDVEKLATDAAATAELNRLNALLSQGRPVSAADLEALEKLYTKFPGAPAVRQALQRGLMKRHDWAAAEKLIRDIPVAEWTSTERFNLANSLVKQGRFAEVPDILKPLAGSDENVDAAALIGTAHYYNGNSDAAESVLAPLRNELAAARKVDELAVLGMVYSRKGDDQKAIEVLQQALAIAPENYSANNAIIRAYAAAGDTANAEAARARLESIYDRFAANERRKSRLVPLFYQLEEAYNNKEYDKVIAVARQIEPDADEATKRTVYQYIGLALRAQGKEAEAQQALAEAARPIQK